MRAATKTGHASTTSRASSRRVAPVTGVVRVDRGAIAGGLDVDHQLAEPDPIRHRLGHPLRQPAVAFRPGQHHVAVLGIGIARRVVVHAGPRRRPGQIGPEVVAARVLHPPAQAGRGEAARGEELGHRDAVELAERAGRARRPRRGEGAPARGVAPAPIARPSRGERPRAARGPLRWRRARGKKPSCHRPWMNNALLRRVAQVALVVDRTAVAVESFDHAELTQQRAHPARLGARVAAGSARPTDRRSRPTLRPGRCRPARPRARAARRSRTPRTRQVPGGGQPRHSGAHDHDRRRARSTSAAASRRGSRSKCPSPCAAPTNPPSIGAATLARHPPPPAAPPANNSAESSQRCRTAPRKSHVRKSHLQTAAHIEGATAPPRRSERWGQGARGPPRRDCPVVLDEDLVVEAVDLDGHGGHVGREREQRRRGLDREEAQARRVRAAAASSRPRRPARSPTRRRTARRRGRDARASPALRIVSMMHQNDRRANIGEVACTTATPPGASRAAEHAVEACACTACRARSCAGRGNRR